MQVGAESNLNSPTPRVRVIRQLPFQPSALSMVVRRRVATSEHEKQLKNPPIWTYTRIYLVTWVLILIIINTSYQKLPFGSGDYPDKLLFHQALNYASNSSDRELPRDMFRFKTV